MNHLRIYQIKVLQLKNKLKLSRFLMIMMMIINKYNLKLLLKFNYKFKIVVRRMKKNM